MVEVVASLQEVQAGIEVSKKNPGQSLQRVEVVA
jgi:hypothetical protein